MTSTPPLSDWISYFANGADSDDDPGENFDPRHTATLMRSLALRGDPIGLHMSALVRLPHADDCSGTVIDRQGDHVACTTCGRCTTVSAGRPS